MKPIIKNLFRRFGLDIIKYYPSPLERAKAIDFHRKGAKFIKMLTLHEIDLVIDVGANIGQYASNLFVTGYQGKVLSFEPLSSAYEKLVLASKSYPDWEVAERCAIGDINGEIDINIANNSESSSVLPMLQAHLDAAEQSAYIGSEKVKIYKLSDIAAFHIQRAHATFLKIDTQGYEDRVLQGAAEIIPQIKGLYLEFSLVPLYGGQILFEEMLHKVKEMGFTLYDLHPGFADYRTGRLLQVNGTFFRESENW